MSVLYSHFTESVHGITTIRAFHRLEEFRIEALKKIDLYQKAFYTRMMILRYESLQLYLMQGIHCGFCWFPVDFRAHSHTCASALACTPACTHVHPCPC